MIKETLTRTAPPEQYFELQHVYIKDVGEVERQESVRQPSGQMRVVTRMTLVDEEDLAPPGVPKVSLKNGKAGSRTPVK